MKTISDLKESDLTALQKILLAAAELCKANVAFTSADLVVVSWQYFPASFGLEGYTKQHPDSNKVLSALMGKKGLANRGLLVKGAGKFYSITRDGRALVNKLLGIGPPDSAPLRKLYAAYDTFVRTISCSPAAIKFEEHRKTDVSFQDACKFWNISESAGGSGVVDRLTQMRMMLEELERDLSEGDAELTTGRIITAGDIRALKNVHEFLLDRFTSRLRLMTSVPGDTRRGR